MSRRVLSMDLIRGWGDEHVQSWLGHVREVEGFVCAGCGRRFVVGAGVVVVDFNSIHESEHYHPRCLPVRYDDPIQIMLRDRCRREGPVLGLQARVLLRR